MEATEFSSSGHNSKQPLVTVGMPIYNAGNYLRQAVLSIVYQTFTDWELIIIDDASTDNALESISDIKDPRIHIFKHTVNKALAARLNEAIDLARGKYFARMDQDDVSHPERFELQVKTLEQQPDLDLLCVRARKISLDNSHVGYMPYCIQHQEIISKPWSGFRMTHPTWMGKLSWFKKYYYREPQSYYSEDYELLLRSYKYSHFACLSEILFDYRVRDTIIWKRQLKTRITVLKLQTKHFLKHMELIFLALSYCLFMLKACADLFTIVKQKLKKTNFSNL